MNYLQLVQQAITKSGNRLALPSTLAGATGITADFADWVADSWRELQEESDNWFFRLKLDQTLDLTASDDEYDMPDGLETLNFRTVTVYTDSKVDEVPLEFVRYEYWRIAKDTISTSEGRPKIITERPDGVLQIWPVPDQAYTMRYDGVWDIDELENDADEPGTNRTGARTLPARYDYLLVWDAVRRCGEHHQDPDMIAKAQPKYLAQRARLSEKQTPPVYVKPGLLTGRRYVYSR